MYNVALTDLLKAYQLYEGSKNKHTVTEEIDLTWAMILSSYFTGDKKNAKELYRALKKEYPSFVNVIDLRQLPLIWSDQTLRLIATVASDFK